DADTLASAAEAMPAGVSGLSDLTNGAAEHVFVYGFKPTDRHGAILRQLSSSALLGVQAQTAPDARFRVADGHRHCCGLFSGLSRASVVGTGEQCFLQSRSEQAGKALIRSGNAPFFVRVEKDASATFFSAARELADLDESVPRPARPLAWFSRLIPLL